MVTRDAAKRRVAAVKARRTMVTHDKNLAFGYLVRELYVTVAKRLVGQVGFLQANMVDRDRTILLNVHPLYEKATMSPVL